METVLHVVLLVGVIALDHLTGLIRGLVVWHNNRAFLRPRILLCSICIRFLCNWVGREYFFVPFAFINFAGSIHVPCSVYVFFWARHKSALLVVVSKV